MEGRAKTANIHEDAKATSAHFPVINFLLVIGAARMSSRSLLRNRAPRAVTLDDRVSIKNRVVSTKFKGMAGSKAPPANIFVVSSRADRVE
jgi:hypothetical protein